MRDRETETRGRQAEGQCTVDAQCKLGKNLHLGFAEYFLIFSQLCLLLVSLTSRKACFNHFDICCFSFIHET